MFYKGKSFSYIQANKCFRVVVLREGVECKLRQYPKLFKHVLPLVCFKTLGTFNKSFHLIIIMYKKDNFIYYH